MSLEDMVIPPEYHISISNPDIQDSEISELPTTDITTEVSTELEVIISEE